MKLALMDEIRIQSNAQHLFHKKQRLSAFITARRFNGFSREARNPGLLALINPFKIIKEKFYFLTSQT